MINIRKNMAKQASTIYSIPIRDPETNECYTIEVTASEIQRLNTDQYFATKKLEEAKNLALAQAMDDGVFELVEDLDSESALGEPAQDPERQNNSECSGTAFKWSHDAILLLIEEYRTNEDSSKSRKMSQKKLREKISAVLNSYAHKITGPQCQSKFSEMKKTYKNIKDHNNKSGNSRQTWVYFDLVDGLLGDKPFIAPVVTCSSTGKKRRQSDSESSSASYSSLEESDNIPSRKVKSLLGDKMLDRLQENARIREENENRRFQEYMSLKERQENENRELKRRAIELLEKLVEKS